MMRFLKNSVGLTDLLLALKSFHIVRVMGGQDIKQRYKRSRLGPFWITISMAIMITTMGIVFGNLFKADMKDFFPFLTLGIVIWSFISSSLSEGCEALISSEGIIKQLPVPLHIHVLRTLWKNIIIFLHNIAILPFVLLFLGRGINFYVFLAIPGFLLIIVNLLWVMMTLSIICARFRDFTQIILSVIQVVFYLTPVMWMPNLLPNRFSKVLLDFNPVYHLISIVRDPFLGHAPNYLSYIVASCMAIVGIIFSTYLTSKYKYRVSFWV